jgi:hypothetical protein
MDCVIATVKDVLFSEETVDSKTATVEDVLFLEDAVKVGFRYKLLSDPTYAYSMRRINNNGLPRTAMSAVRFYTKRLLGDDFSENDCNYKMLGGGDYKE